MERERKWNGNVKEIESKRNGNESEWKWIGMEMECNGVEMECNGVEMECNGN
jgi:hypothetical protein